MSTFMMMTTLLISAAPADIDRVVLMPDRAEVVRLQSTACGQGTADLVFEPLPTSLDPRTLRAEAEGRTEVLGIRHETGSLEEAVGAQAEAVRKEREALADAAAALHHRARALDERTDRVEKMVQLFRATVSEQLRDGKDRRSRWTAALDRFRDERAALAAARRDLDVERRALTRRQNRLDRRWARLSGRSRQFIRATVSVACRGPRAEARLAYVVPQARWRPEYDLDFRPESRRRGQARLTVSAIVEQSTGEDWRNVQLVLSTARPRLGASAPYPAALRIDGSEKDSDKVLVEGYEDRRSVRAGGPGAARGPLGAELDDGGNTVSLTLPGRVTVLADGQQHWFPVDESSAPARQAYVAYPRLRRGVFRVVRFENPAGYPLLAGRINSFVRGDYVGSAPLELAGAGAPVEVSLGLEPGLAVDRTTRTDREAVRGFLSKSKHLARAYRTTLANRTDRAFEVDVREQVPVAQNEAIEVRMLADGTTTAYRLDKDRGIVSWTVQVPANERRRVDLAFEIELPDDWKMKPR